MEPFHVIALVGQTLIHSHCVGMVAILAGVLVYYNVIDKAPVTETKHPVSDGMTPSDEPTLGNQVGDLCYSTDIKVLKGEGETFNVQNTRGKVTVINFWYTTCGPCLQELPHFEEVNKQYGDRIYMIAICANFDQNEAPNFITQNFAEYTMNFGLDNADEAYYYQLGGGVGYPMTLVLDADGVIVAVKEGAMSKDELTTALDTALAKES